MNKTQASISLCLSLGTTSLVGEGGGGGWKIQRLFLLRDTTKIWGVFLGRDWN